jgi:metallo-beta-lactamase family protein
MSIYTSRKECEFLNNMQIKKIQNKADLQKFQKDTGPKILIASAGMMQNGAIIKHLPEILPLPNNRVCLIGYMSEGSIGRLLYDGKKIVEIPSFGRIEVSAKIIPFKSFSGHGDEHDLLDLAKSLKLKQDKNTQLFINHGEYDGSALALKNAFSRKKVIDANRIVIPDTTTCYQIF